MKSIWNKFLKSHFERHVFIYEALTLMTALYVFIPDAQAEIRPLYFIVIGIFINKARGGSAAPDDKPIEPPRE